VFWICLTRFWRDLHSALAIVKPERVVSLVSCRSSFVLDLESAVRPPRMPRHFARDPRSDPQDVSGKSRAGCPRIHGELLTIGIDIKESSVSKYKVRCC